MNPPCHCPAEAGTCEPRAGRLFSPVLLALGGALFATGCPQSTASVPAEVPGERAWKEISEPDRVLAIGHSIARPRGKRNVSGAPSNSAISMPVGTRLEINGTFSVQSGSLPVGTMLVACYRDAARKQVLYESRSAPDPVSIGDGKYSFKARIVVPDARGRYRIELTLSSMTLAEQLIDAT
jgi:hypothetical protein